MKTVQLLTSSLLASATVIESRFISHDRRQLLNPLTGAPKAPMFVKKLNPQFDDKAVREVVLFGPFKLQRVNGTHASGLMKVDSASDAFTATLNGLCSECVVLGAQAEVAFSNGTLADLSSGVYSHHIMISAVGKSQTPNPVNVKCNGQTTSGFGGGPTTQTNSTESSSFGKAASGLLKSLMPALFIVNGGDGSMVKFTAKKNSNVKSGYFVPKKASMVLTMEIVNYDDFPKNIYLSLDYEYLEHRPDAYLDVSMAAINIDGCPGISFYPPTDKAVTIKSPEWNVIDNGYLINITPHLHDGGIFVQVFKNGDQVCNSDAIYGAQGKSHKEISGQKWETITSYGDCNKPVPVKKGDKLTMVAQYDATKHRLRPNSMDHGKGAEAMAMAFFQFAKEVTA